MRKRPIKPAESTSRKKQWGIASLGHPNGSGLRSSQRRGGEYLEAGGKDSGDECNSNSISNSSSINTTSNTVGSGQNKWVSKREFIPWNPNTIKVKAHVKHPTTPKNNDDSDIISEET